MVIGAMLIPFGFTLFVTAPMGVIFADEPQDSVLFEDFECLNCHTDKTRLTELAAEVPEEEEASLSSGPG